MSSKDHANRRSHNWLMYKLGDSFLESYIRYYRGTLYDLGCGERPYEQFLLKYCDRYVGVDWGETRHHLVADVVANLNEELPVKSEAADTVVSFAVLEHLSEPQTMLNEAFRILRPGGHVVLSVPFQWHVHEAPYDFYRYTRYGLEYLFKKAGFSDVEVNAVGGFWPMWFLKFNYQTLRLLHGPKPLRWLLRAALIPVWWVDQYLALILDRIWPNSENETVAYFVVARKP
jgi:SAM-dependent methyltransferase